MITEILEYLNSTGTSATSKRIKRKIEKVPRTESINAIDYGHTLSFMSKMGLVDKGNTGTNKWKIKEKGKKWLNNEIDVREL